MKRKFIIGTVAVLLAAAMWTYVDRILIPHQKEQAARSGIPRGNLSDLYPRWLGAREWLLRHRDPYGAEVTREIQRGYWGRELNSANPNDPRDQAGFAYPAYVIFFLAPTVNLPFRAVQVGFGLLLIVLTAVTVPLWAGGIGARLSWAATAAAAVLLLGSWPAVQGLHLQQLTLFVAALLAGACAFLASGRQVSAGMLLAAATIKPQLALPLAAWLAVWTLGNLRRRQRFAWAFAISLLALAGGAQWLMPGWITRWRAALDAYLVYNHAMPLLQSLFGRWTGRALELVFVGLTGLACWRRRRAEAGTPEFGLATALALSASLVVMPKWAPYDQVLLLPAALWIATNWPGVGATGRGRVLSWLSIAVLGWQWVAAALLVLLAGVSAGAARRLDWLPLATVVFVPVMAIALLTAISLTSDATSGRGDACPRDERFAPNWAASGEIVPAAVANHTSGPQEASKL